MVLITFLLLAGYLWFVRPSQDFSDFFNGASGSLDGFETHPNFDLTDFDENEVITMLFGKSEGGETVTKIEEKEESKSLEVKKAEGYGQSLYIPEILEFGPLDCLTNFDIWHKEQLPSDNKKEERLEGVQVPFLENARLPFSGDIQEKQSEDTLLPPFGNEQKLHPPSTSNKSKKLTEIKRPQEHLPVPSLMESTKKTKSKSTTTTATAKTKAKAKNSSPKQKQIAYPASKKWLSAKREIIRERYQYREFQKSKDLGIFRLISGYNTFESATSRQFCFRQKYKMEIKRDSFWIVSKTKAVNGEKELRRTHNEDHIRAILGDGKNDGSGGIVGVFKKGNLKIYSVGTFFRAFLWDGTLISELESEKSVHVQENNVLFMVPDGTTMTMITDCLKLGLGEEMIYCLAVGFQNAHKLNGEFLAAAIG